MRVKLVLCLCLRGKFGQVFKLVEKATKKVWAGKFIKAYSAKEKENVRQEIGIMNSLHHPKLVQCIDAFEGKSDIVMVLEMYVTFSLRTTSVTLVFVCYGRFFMGSVRLLDSLNQVTQGRTTDYLRTLAEERSQRTFMLLL